MSTHPIHPVRPVHPTVETHPLVQAYLADLDRALAGADPRERADVLDGVREHLKDALGESLGGDQSAETSRVREVLADLGPVETIAAQATPTAPPASTRRDTTSLVALLAAITAAALVFIPFVSIPLATAALITSAVHLRSPAANRRRCWAGIAVSATTLLVLVVAGASLVAASNSWNSSPTAVTSLPTE